MASAERIFCLNPVWNLFARRLVLRWATQHRTLEGSALELGAGSGAMASQLSRQCPALRITAIDVDPRMVRHRRPPRRDDLRVRPVVADATALPFADEAFDHVTCFLMLHHVVNWEAALTETRRVLKPGGQFLGYDLTSTRASRWLHRVDRSPHRLLDPDDLVGGLRDSGFSTVEVMPGAANQVMRFRAVRALTGADG